MITKLTLFIDRDPDEYCPSGDLAEIAQLISEDASYVAWLLEKPLLKCRVDAVSAEDLLP